MLNKFVITTILIVVPAISWANDAVRLDPIPEIKVCPRNLEEYAIPKLEEICPPVPDGSTTREYQKHSICTTQYSKYVNSIYNYNRTIRQCQQASDRRNSGSNVKIRPAQSVTTQPGANTIQPEPCGDSVSLSGLPRPCYNNQNSIENGAAVPKNNSPSKSRSEKAAACEKMLDTDRNGVVAICLGGDANRWWGSDFEGHRKSYECAARVVANFNRCAGFQAYILKGSAGNPNDRWETVKNY